jgi:hypothetical protein
VTEEEEEEEEEEEKMKIGKWIKPKKMKSGVGWAVG